MSKLVRIEIAVVALLAVVALSIHLTNGEPCELYPYLSHFAAQFALR